MPETSCLSVILRLPALLRRILALRHATQRQKDDLDAADQALKEYREVLNIYLSPCLHQPPTWKGAKPFKALKADASLTRLPLLDLRDHAEDICHEIMRRHNGPGTDMRIHMQKADTSAIARLRNRKGRNARIARRHHLRTSLALLNEPQLQRISVSVLFEIEQRIPRLVQVDDVKELRRMSRDSQRGDTISRRSVEVTKHRDVEAMDLEWHKNLDKFLGALETYAEAGAERSRRRVAKQKL